MRGDRKCIDKIKCKIIVDGLEKIQNFFRSPLGIRVPS